MIPETNASFTLLCLLSGLLMSCAPTGGAGQGGEGGAEIPMGTTGQGGTGGREVPMGTTGQGGTGGMDVPTGTTGSGGSNSGPFEIPTLVAPFEPLGCLSCPPDGLDVKEQVIYVGLLTGEILTIDSDTFDVSPFGWLPQPDTMADGLMLGIAVNFQGDVYAAFAGTPGAVPSGIYKVSAGQAVEAPWAIAPGMDHPNGLLIDGDFLYVADSGGRIFRTDIGSGTTELWAEDPLLDGEGEVICDPLSPLLPLAVGANGIVSRTGADGQHALYVSNTSRGMIVKIPFDGDGMAGIPEIFAGQDCLDLGGIDGLAVDPSVGGFLLGVVNTQNKLVRIGADGMVKKLSSGDAFDYPASIAVSKGVAYVTNSAYFNEVDPAPGLVAYSPPAP